MGAKYEPWHEVETVIDGKAATATDSCLERALKPYRPGSGTEGMAFDDAWCDHCARDAEYRKDPDINDPATGCQILARTFAYEIDHPKYPKEWIHGRDGRPCCTAFSPVTETVVRPFRCEKTPDFFGARSDD
jgi:hypothetical protein